jgi:hypothetical protein
MCLEFPNNEKRLPGISKRGCSVSDITYKHRQISSALIFSILFSGIANSASILGISWGTGHLKSVDPYTGLVLDDYGRISSDHDNFSGLAYDENNGILYAKDNADSSLFGIDVSTGSINTISLGRGDLDNVNSLNFVDGTLYGVIADRKSQSSGGTTTYWWESDLVTIDTSDGSILSSLRLSDEDHVSNITYVGNTNEFIALIGSNLNESGRIQDRDIAMINAISGGISLLFPTEINSSGFAVLPGNESLIGWENTSTHNFTQIDLDSGVITQLAISDVSGLSAGGFIYHDFSVAPLMTVSDPLPEIPVPAAVWLFGSALGLLGWMRRKKA